MSAQEDTTARGAPRRKLGKGLGALLGEARREEPLVRPGREPSPDDSTGLAPAPTGEGLASLSVAAIEPHPEQPRRHFDEEALNELAVSIGERGVIQPVIVRPLGEGRYQLVAGERRWRAAQKAQLHEIPALIRDLEEQDVMAIALIENIQREDLNPVEEARAYQRLGEQLPPSSIAGMVGKSRSHVVNMQRLLALPAAVLEHLEAGRLGMGHARALIGHPEAEALAERAVAENLSVREVEKLGRKAPARRQARDPRDPAQDADIAAVQNHLEEFLGLTVRIATDADPRSGAVTIRYRTLDQLDLICQRLTGASI
uniref:ParB/RepB/Spo0J family partition protein n=1 Tax=Altererythrobacter segetis TaxID=1104773 RepID=UPI001409D347|nr:ParB/RepB/Spo0J family partition protein [Altererythrobacter segetis]